MISKACNVLDTVADFGLGVLWKGSDHFSACTEATSNFCKVGAVEITTAAELWKGQITGTSGDGTTHLILKRNPLLPRQQLPQLVEIRPLPESVEPDEGADDDNAERVDN